MKGGPVPGRGSVPGLLEKLLAAVRPEFRSDELVFRPQDPVFGGRPCLVPGCARFADGKELCKGHRRRWTDAGRPGLREFAAAADPAWRGKDAPLSCCTAPGCRYGAGQNKDLCVRHAGAWKRAGTPELPDWLSMLPCSTPDPAPAGCLIAGCRLWAEPWAGWCRSHAATWIRRGRPPAGQFAAEWAARIAGPGFERRIRLDGLPPQLKLEVQYALQRRNDERTAKAPPVVVMAAVRFLAASGATSLLDRTRQEWRDHPGRPQKQAVTQLTWFRAQIADLAEGTGWESEYERDAWQMHRLGYGTRSVLDFSGIPQPQLKDLAKRWIRWRLATGLEASAGGTRPLRALTRFAVLLDARGIAGTSGIDRAVIEDYLADLHTTIGSNRKRADCIGMASAFLTAVRQHGWDPALPATAVFLPGDQPRRGEQLPRALAGHVMAQVEDPANLARQPDPARRLATLILIRCGLRVSDALRLPFDCIVTDDNGPPYLRYYNHKMKREALVPVDEELQALISEQRQRILDLYHSGTVLFPRATKNPDGRMPVGSPTYRLGLYRWLADCDIRDEHGQPVHLTPHQWRHTLGTILINRDVPQHVVQKILDHDSPQMTAHYARLSDKTVREHWEKARKVNAEGRPARVRADGPLGEAAWAKQRLSRATQALPNGYCELPLVRTCPHANSCLTCPMFVTSAEFLPQHHAQRRQTLQIISAAEANGQSRLAEMNRQVSVNLDKIIAALEDGGEEEKEASAGAS